MKTLILIVLCLLAMTGIACAQEVPLPPPDITGEPDRTTIHVIFLRTAQHRLYAYSYVDIVTPDGYIIPGQNMCWQAADALWWYINANPGSSMVRCVPVRVNTDELLGQEPD